MYEINSNKYKSTWQHQLLFLHYCTPNKRWKTAFQVLMKKTFPASCLLMTLCIRKQKSIGRGGRCAWSPLLKLVGTLRKCSRNDERLREKSLSNLRLQSVCWKLIKADLFRFIAWILFSKVLFFSNKRTRLQLQIMSFFIRIKIHWLILRYKSSKSKFPFTVSSQLSLQTFL